MKLIGDGAGGRKLIVRVKLDHRSRKLQKPATSLLSVAKIFDSVLAVYEVFCNLKQVGSRLKVCRGGSRFWCKRPRRLAFSR
ncbi:hypothetical protein PHAVU_007G013100 [Phaseolus vulgaris]|uniref:Uncharacterized protein n=1 Tax=Phaseolus vulgaris TaxID=3885 RepID=V7BAY8_PHAVU|nr:hypothetical protein PHAVU_007G013100g [Phaseolus vulgaris]ESW14735.1 hypothetical protein PHAVU_007G013100g [Phaseolus vulgaris]